MNNRDLEKQFREMVKELDGDKAHNDVAGSVCEHYAIVFAKRMVEKITKKDKT